MKSYQALAALYDRLMDDVDYDAWGAYLVRLLKERGIAKGSVLDAACGTGSLTLQFARAGYSVTGLDLSPEMLQIASERLRKAGQRVMFTAGNMTKIALHRPVEVIHAGCDGVNYLTEREDVLSFFRSAYENLKPGGVLLFDVSSAHKLNGMDGQFYAEDRDDVAYIWNNSMENGVLTMDLTFFVRRSDGLYTRQDEVHHQRAHTQEELTALLTEAGFSEIDCYGFLTEEAPLPDAARLMFAANKGE